MTERLAIITWISWGPLGAIASITLLNVTNEQLFIGPKLRDRRALIFQEYGEAKFVCGFSLPVSSQRIDPPWESLGAVFSFEAQYSVPTKPLYWWQKWNGETLQEARALYDKSGIYPKDESRIFIYSIIENYLNRTGRNGRQCLQRTICENALASEGGDILSKIILLILKPDDFVDEVFRDAYKAGRYGVKCATQYPECPLGKGFLDGLTVIEDAKYYAAKHRILRETEKETIQSIFDWDIWNYL